MRFLKCTNTYQTSASECYLRNYLRNWSYCQNVTQLFKLKLIGIMCHLIFLVPFLLLFTGEAVNVELIYSGNEAWDYPVPHLASGISIKASLPSFPPHVPGAAHVGSWREVQINFYVLPLISSVQSLILRSRRMSLSLGIQEMWILWLTGVCLCFTGLIYSVAMTSCKVPSVGQHHDWSCPAPSRWTSGSADAAALVATLKSNASPCGWWDLGQHIAWC